MWQFFCSTSLMNKEISLEFSNIKLGDKRLNSRVQQIVERLVEKPDASFPNVFPNPAELETFYRFVENPYVKSDQLFDGHKSATLQRCANHDQVLVIHDTTKFTFSGNRLSLGDKNSFPGHCSLALDKSGGVPLGVLRMDTWVREGNAPSPSALRKAGLLTQNQARKLPSEMDRWLRSVNKTAALFPDHKKLVHICDSEGDDYAFLAGLVREHRFVMRGCYNRKIAATSDFLLNVLNQAPFICQRTVHLSKRVKSLGDEKQKRNQARDERVAKLSIHCAAVTICRPQHALSSLPKELSLNVVYVKEIEPPSTADPVEWILLSSESIANKEDVLRIVDIYRSRWKVEEFFKALKTGCSFESRQLESYSTLLICMTILMPIAWLMLRMRAESRRSEPVPASQILPQMFIEVLQAHTNAEVATAQTALLAIARLGGHIKANGPPGWLVIWRGFRELAILARGFMLAQSISFNLSRKRCDQS